MNGSAENGLGSSGTQFHMRQVGNPVQGPSGGANYQAEGFAPPSGPAQPLTPQQVRVLAEQDRKQYLEKLQNTQAKSVLKTRVEDILPGHRFNLQTSTPNVFAEANN